MKADSTKPLKEYSYTPQSSTTATAPVWPRAWVQVQAGPSQHTTACDGGWPRHRLHPAIGLPNPVANTLVALGPACLDIERLAHTTVWLPSVWSRLKTTLHESGVQQFLKACGPNSSVLVHAKADS